MTKAEMQVKIRGIFLEGKQSGFKIFACLREGNRYYLKRLRITDELRDTIYEKIYNTLEQNYLAEDVEYDSSDNIADNKNCLYEIVQDQQYHPFDFLIRDYRIDNLFSETDKDYLFGYLFRVNLNDDFFWIYQHVYSMSRIDRSRRTLAYFIKNAYDIVEGDILQIDARVDLVVIENSIITSKMDLLQKYFSFERVIRRCAKQTISIIDQLGIVQGLEKFIAFGDNKKLTNAKKLMKARNSKVLTIDGKELLVRIKEHSRYSTMFTFENDQIIIRSQKDAAAFIKMVNDDILRSDLTGQEYESQHKSMLY